MIEIREVIIKEIDSIRYLQPEGWTVSGMNAQSPDHTNQRSKNHFLTHSNWDDQCVTNERLNRLYQKEDDSRLQKRMANS